MVSQYINQVFTDNTVGQTILSLALAIILVLIGLIVFIVAMANYKKRAYLKQYYLENVIAFKVGLIHKKAAEASIELKYAPKSDLVVQLEEEVSKDLNTT